MILRDVQGNDGSLLATMVERAAGEKPLLIPALPL
jgi:hypothetical protein